MALTELIQVTLNNTDVKETTGVDGTLARTVYAGDKVFYFDSSISVTAGQGLLFGNGAQGVFRVVSTETVNIGGGSLYAITSNEAPEETIAAGEDVYIVNAVSDSAPVFSFSINSDRMDLSPSAAFVEISGTSVNAEYSGLVIPAERKTTAVSAFEEVGTFTRTKIEPDTRVLGYNGGSTVLRPGTPVQLEHRAGTYEVREHDTSGGNLILDAQVAPVQWALISTQKREFGDSTLNLTDQETSRQTGLADGSGGLHQHSIPRHTHNLIRRNNGFVKNNDTDLNPVNGDYVTHKGVQYLVSSYNDSTKELTISGYFEHDQMVDDIVYASTVASGTTVSASLWRHRGEIQISPLFNYKQSVQKVVFNFSLYEGGAVLAQKTFLFYRPGIVGSVEELGEHKYRLYLHGETPGATNALNFLGAQDYFTTQELDGVSESFDAPARPGWESDQ